MGHKINENLVLPFTIASFSFPVLHKTIKKENIIQKYNSSYLTEGALLLLCLF